MLRWATANYNTIRLQPRTAVETLWHLKRASKRLPLSRYGIPSLSAILRMPKFYQSASTMTKEANEPLTRRLAETAPAAKP